LLRTGFEKSPTMGVVFFVIKMKRKIIKQGPSTFMISLPKKWAEKHRIDKGAEIEIEEMEGYLLVKPEKKEAKMQIDIESYSLLNEEALKKIESSGIQINIKCKCGAIMRETETIIDGIKSKAMICQRCNNSFMTPKQKREFEETKKLNNLLKNIKIIVPKELHFKKLRTEVLNSRSFIVNFD